MWVMKMAYDAKLTKEVAAYLLCSCSFFMSVSDPWETSILYNTNFFVRMMAVNGCPQGFHATHDLGFACSVCIFCFPLLLPVATNDVGV
jgi:hypothetical protein